MSSCLSEDHVLCPSGPQSLSLTSAFHQPRERSHLPVFQVQSLKKMTVIGHLQLNARGRVTPSGSIITKQIGWVRAGALGAGQLFSENKELLAVKQSLAMNFNLTSCVTFHFYLPFQQFRNTFNFQKQWLTHSMCQGTCISLLSFTELLSSFISFILKTFSIFLFRAVLHFFDKPS